MISSGRLLRISWRRGTVTPKSFPAHANTDKEEISFSLARIRQSGGYITTSESAAFQLQCALFNCNVRFSIAMCAFHSRLWGPRPTH
ncbi:uncharacterized protein HD556DRAFT_435024 [Suillus plorans]|uniref:Uncharacterized protein n=1 Tax=Suillus plorans TaxID=116603 RepID=A0A9P7ASE3_9AGAM|nr:uncharacterized protein HD556DRAFT_435024 [Suillus plorans]KAG1794452.1 hypothetical protein HD556DRAFT_435024 [Suillus plorans]